MDSLLAFKDKTTDEIEAILKQIPENHPLKREIDKAIWTDPKIWRPLPGPQSMAYFSQADILGFGGAAGGGKSDLGIGLALTQHRRSFIVRQEATQLTGIIDRISEIVGTRDGYNGQEKIFRLPKRLWHRNLNKQIEFGSLPNPGDERKYQGRPKDLLLIDEATAIMEAAARFIMGWVRTTDYQQRTRTVMTFNPPTDAAGRWVVSYFAPWLDKYHPVPALPGELRWFAAMDGADVEVVSGEPFLHRGEKIKPLSRTFIPSRIKDNPYLLNTGYMATLQSLPEPLRSQMLYGDFEAGMEDDAWQVIPTAWVEAAQKRWQMPTKKPTMESLGVDVARGGKDKTIIARRHQGLWFDEPIKHPGKATPDGPSVAGQVIAAARDLAPIHIDVIGVGASPYDFLRNAHQQVIGVNVAEKATKTDMSGRLKFRNLRSQLWWMMREALDPSNNTGIALPNDRDLLIELCAPLWDPKRLPVVKVESREEIIERIGRSPDTATAFILAMMDTPKAMPSNAAHKAAEILDYDPYAYMKRR